MANMSYCRFQNTLADLLDCHHNWNESDNDPDDELSREEAQARRDLLEVCREIVEAHEGEGDEVRNEMYSRRGE